MEICGVDKENLKVEAAGIELFGCFFGAGFLVGGEGEGCVTAAGGKGGGRGEPCE